jgi:GNAT superfamily N-acetyltransferase
VYAAISEFDELMGVTTLVDDDELPDSRELGPWIAAVYVESNFRRIGVGATLVRHAERRARLLGHPSVYLYTEDQSA